MTTTSPSPTTLPAQIQAPGALEFLWEKHRRAVLLVAAVVAIGLAANYVFQYAHRRETSHLWSQIAVVAGLDKAYVEEAPSISLFRQLRQQYAGWDWTQEYFRSARAELVTALLDDVQTVDSRAIEDVLPSVIDTDAEPLVRWFGARKALGTQEWDKAFAFAAAIDTRFPKHFLSASSPYPVQFRPPLVKKDDGGKPPVEPGDTPADSEAEELAPPEEGSQVGRFRRVVEREKEFREAHQNLYAAPDSDASPTVVVRLSNDQMFKIRFYRDKAPKHVESFLARVGGGDFYPGQRIDEVHRKGTQSRVEQLHFGLAASKQSDDRTEWIRAKGTPSGTQLEFESNDLSHFPGMVAAALDSDGKSSGERVWITANDAGADLDGQRVIFGRVVEGMEAVEHICREATFTTDEMRASGQGQLQLNIAIESITVEG